ncbi:MAG TPA: YihY/virulence factor BrkB family protein [Solirubrobacteraceae bacterium]|jgi:YihY family inner membrane protein|nr:YihY/virulence factor BrkB family protein [Solirubrobacteraceae bacterium]
MSAVEKVDTFQQRRKPLAIGVAAFKKFKEDQSTSLAAMVAFWAFFSVFPLLMVLVTILGWVLPASDKTNVLTHVADMFPVLNPKTIHGLTGSLWALLVGLLTSLWSGIGVVRTVQTAFNSVWEIPMHERPGLKEQILRSLWILATLGLGLVLSTLISGLVTGASTGLNLGVVGHVVGLVIAVALDVGLFVAAFRMLTDQEISARDVLPGAVFSGLVFFILTELSSFIISRHLKGSQSTYGTFATVITILWWFYLQAVVTMLGAQINVVLKHGFYPRSLAGPPDTEADHRALQAYAEERKYHPQEQVETKVPSGEDNGGGAES